MNQTTPPAVPPPLPAADQRRPPGSGSLIVFGPVAGFVGMMVAGGNGWSPLVHLVGGFVAALVLDLLVRWWKPCRSFLAILGVLLMVGLASASLAYVTAHPPPSAAFQKAFGIAPPAGVSNLQVKRQWYDGVILVIRFKATPAAITALTSNAARPLTASTEPIPNAVTEPADWMSWWQLHFNEAAIADRSIWREPPTLTSPQVFSWGVEGPPREIVWLLWDAVTGDTYAMYTWGGT